MVEKTRNVCEEKDKILCEEEKSKDIINATKTKTKIIPDLLPPISNQQDLLM